MDHPTTQEATPDLTPIRSGWSLPSFRDVGQLDVGVGPAAAQIIGLASATPDRLYTQRDLLSLFGFAGNAFAEAIFERSDIATRPLYLAPEEFGRTDDPYFQYERSQAACLEMAAEAIAKALAAAGLTVAEVDALALATTSQLHMPSLTALLVHRLGLRRDLDQYNLLGHGCAAAVPLLQVADGYLRRHPGRKVLAVAVDVGSVLLQPVDPGQKGAVVANSLFSDAAVALVLAGGPGRPGRIAVVDTALLQGAPDTVDAAVYAMAPTGARLSVLSRELPAHSVGVVAPAVDGLLARHGLTRADVDHWAFHPGGRAILDGLQAALDLSDAQLVASRAVLRDVGNAAAPTCLLTLERVAAGARPGQWGVVAAVGPGLIAAAALVRWT